MLAIFYFSSIDFPLLKIFCSLTAMRVDFLKPLTDLEVKEKQTARFECEISRPNVKVCRHTF